MHPLDVRQVPHCPIPPTAVTSLSPVPQVPISLHDGAVPHPFSHPNPPLTFPLALNLPSFPWLEQLRGDVAMEERNIHNQ